ncbi:DUF6476 family protein [Oceanibium sediminis]|uniref:DUF6476 family protein n=1 Tax=Oceanibium sediminis TaxID=2026339 RepID=UPI000DD44D00|nr:DUF6476 family protein [Oceanibium sediminis]
MSDDFIQQEAPEPPRIRTLRRLVTALTVVLTLGMIIVVGLLVWRLVATPATPPLPGTVALPAGQELTGYAQNPDWVVLITRDGNGAQYLHLVAPGEDTPHQSVTVTPLAE